MGCEAVLRCEEPRSGPRLGGQRETDPAMPGGHFARVVPDRIQPLQSARGPAPAGKSSRRRGQPIHPQRPDLCCTTALPSRSRVDFFCKRGLRSDGSRCNHRHIVRIVKFRLTAQTGGVWSGQREHQSSTENPVVRPIRRRHAGLRTGRVLDYARLPARRLGGRMFVVRTPDFLNPPVERLVGFSFSGTPFGWTAAEPEGEHE